MSRIFAGVGEDGGLTNCQDLNRNLEARRQLRCGHSEHEGVIMSHLVRLATTTALLVWSAGLCAPASAAEGKQDVAARVAECRREVVLMLYPSHAARERWVQQCIHQPNKVVRKTPAPRRPVTGTVVPGVRPLGTATTRGGTAPSNTPIQPSAPVVGSSSNSISGSSASSTTGSSGNSLGSSGPGGGSSSTGSGGGM